MGPWAFGVPLVLVSTLGLLVNTYVLLVVCLTKQLQTQQTANTMLLVHLGAVETVMCLVLLIFTTGGLPVVGTSCVLHGFLLALLHPVALWTVTGLNCDRYYAIAAPLHYTALVSPRRVAIGLAGAWTGALLLSLPPFSGLVPPYKYSPGLGCCAPDFGNSSWGSTAAWYGAIYIFLGLALPAVVVTICNLRVLGIARYHRHRIASAIYEVTLSAQVTITHQRNPFSFVPTAPAPAAGGPPRFHSAATTVMQLVGSLYLLYFPYCGVVVWEVCAIGMHARSSVYPRFASLASFLLACSPPINGLLYGLKSRALRRSVQNYWRKKATKSELQQEIQARTPSVAGSRRPSGNVPPSIFPHPPLQRRLSEAILTLGSYKSTRSFVNGNVNGAFNRPRLQTAASCNALRVPTPDSSESRRLIRSSTSVASLISPRYRNDVADADTTSRNDRTNNALSSAETTKRSPRILITRAYSQDSQDGESPLLRKPFTSNFAGLPFEKRKWRHRSTGSDSSTGSSEGGIWTTGIASKIVRNRTGNSADIWPICRQFARMKTLEKGAFFAEFRQDNNSESSDTTDTATTTSTLLTKAPLLKRQSEYLDQICGKKKNAEQEVSESEGSWCSDDNEEREENEIDRDEEDDNDGKYSTGKGGKRVEGREVNGEEKIPLTRKIQRGRKEGLRQTSRIIRAAGEKVHERASQLRPLLISDLRCSS